MKKSRIVEESINRDHFFPLRDETTPIIPAFKKYSEKVFKEKEILPTRHSIQISSLVLGYNIEKLNIIKNRFGMYFPDIVVKGSLCSLEDLKLWVNTRSIDVIFLDSSFELIPEFYVLCQNCTSNIEVIYISENDYTNFLQIEYGATGEVLIPDEGIAFLDNIKKVYQKIVLKNELLIHKNVFTKINIGQSQKDILGIPTVDGFEFMPIEQIICCEGMQKCTRLMFSGKLKILSSYNIGEFRKLLQPFGFFSPHKSFLINLSKIKKYHKEGTLTMSNGQNIPLARRRKESFMNLIKRDIKFPIIPQ